MNSDEFLEKLRKLPDNTRGSFSVAVLNLPKVGAAQAIIPMLKDSNFAVKINALKAIRKHKLDIFEQEILKLLVDEMVEVRVAAIKTLASFGNTKHFKLIKAFYEENKNLRHLIIDSFTNYSDSEEAYSFMLSQITQENDKIRNSAIEWFEKAFNHQILLPWIADSYYNANFKTKRFFENFFTKELPKLFYDERISYRLKLCYLKGRDNNEV
jgi:hypothetical protein